MHKIYKTLALSSLMALTLSACNLTEPTVKSQSKEGREPAPIYTSEQSLQSAKTSDKKEPVKQNVKAAPERLSLDDKGNVVSTVVQDDVSQATDTHNGAYEGSAVIPEGSAITTDEADSSFIESEEQSIRPQSAATSLPNYASGSSFANASCDLGLNTRAKEAAVKLAKALSGRINVDPGQIYVAQSVIPDKYLDCIDDVAKAVASGLVNAPSFNSVTTEHDKMHISSQNIGSARLIPQLVRQCRSHDIPYLAITIVKDIGTTPTLTLRLIRVETGITLSQAYEKLN